MSELLRAGDADRESVAGILRQAHVEGRLETAELEDRLARCYAARTYMELERLVRDLPQSRPQHRRAWPRVPLVLVPVAVGVLLLLVTTHGHVFVVWPLLFFLVVRAARRRPRWH